MSTDKGWENERNDNDKCLLKKKSRQVCSSFIKQCSLEEEEKIRCARNKSQRRHLSSLERVSLRAVGVARGGPRTLAPATPRSTHGSWRAALEAAEGHQGIRQGRRSGPEQGKAQSR